MQFPRQGGGQIETETVDVHLGDPVAQRVHNELQRVRVTGVEAVPGSGVVGIPGEVVVVEFVVGAVIDTSEAQCRSDMVALGGVVVDDVENHLDACLVECAHHCLELGHCSAGMW